MYVTKTCARRAHRHPSMFKTPQMLAVGIQYKYILQNVCKLYIQQLKGSTKTLRPAHMYIQIFGWIYTNNICIFIYIYIFLFDLKNTCQLNSYFGIGYLLRNVHFLTYTYICIEYMLPTFWGIDVSWSFSVRPSGAELGALHFVIYIFVLDIYGQHLGDICQLKVFCAPFGRRVGECTFCKVYFL